MEIIIPQERHALTIEQRHGACAICSKCGSCLSRL